ncbi:MAG: hypothetical protein IT364_12100 [Candidatus Hydrogenedentes bacterium]|nr:hypothetical protein [Candidatus Hydrogenedentota bacterium]
MAHPVTVRASDTRDVTGLTIYLTKPIALGAPAAGAVLPSQEATFTWQAEPAEAVIWTIFLQDTRTTPGLGLQTARQITSPSWTTPSPICPGTYRWVVSGFDSGGRMVGYSDGRDISYSGVSGSTIPQLNLPACRDTLTAMSAPLSWQNPPGTTQYQLQVLPFKNDGPGINIIRNAETSYTIPAPVFGQGNYLLLPDITYQWRVRTSSSLTGLSENDPGWGQWSDWWTFRTPRLPSNTVTLASPATGATVATMTPVLSWTDSTTSNFYYEIEVSKDPSFTTQIDRAVAAVYQNLVHGAVSTPQNSYTLPPAALEANTTYYWRVRPRVQGDGTPLGWSKLGTFCTVPAECVPGSLPGTVPLRSFESPSPFMFSPNFISDRILFASRDMVSKGWSYSVLYRSADRGRTWNPVDAPGFPGVRGLVFSPNFAQDQAIFASGFDPDTRDCAFLRSANAGQIWSPVGTVFRGTICPSGLALSPNFASDQTFIGAYTGTSNVIAQGNVVGGPSCLPICAAFLWVRFSSNYSQDQTIYLAGSQGYSGTPGNGIWVTHDRGSTWQHTGGIIPTEHAGRFQASPNFDADRTIFAIGTPGSYSSGDPGVGVFKTTDAGASWIQVLQGCTGPLTLSPRFGSNGVVYCGNGSDALMSADGGINWRKPSYWPDGIATYAFTPDGSEIWAAMRDGMIFRLPSS